MLSSGPKTTQEMALTPGTYKGHRSAGPAFEEERQPAPNTKRTGGTVGAGGGWGYYIFHLVLQKGRVGEKGGGVLVGVGVVAVEVVTLSN